MLAQAPTLLTKRWHWLVLAIGLALVIGGPFWLVQRAMAAADRASTAVKHTREVETQMLWVLADLRSLEAAALFRARGLDSAALRERIDNAVTRIEPTLARVVELTRDNPQQQVRLGAMANRIDLRMRGAREAIASGGDGGDSEILERMLRYYPVHELIGEFLDVEHRLLETRVAAHARAQRMAQVSVWLGLALQLLTLGGGTWYASVQLARRQHAEDMASRASQRSSLVLDTVREPIVLVDARQRVVMCNAAFSELYGVDRNVRGVPLADIGDGAWRDDQTLRRLHDVLARGRELWDLAMTQRSADGLERHMLVSARRMELPDEEESVALVTVSDVSVQAASERQIRELNRQLVGKIEQVSDVNRELEAFSYSVSHDLRAPLRHIAGFADKLRRHMGEGVDDKSSHYLEVIGGSAKRMSNLIDDLLVYSRLGRSALRVQNVDMQSLVSETRAMLDANSASDQPGHRIQWKVQPLPVVVGDENMLRQVWLNLLGNAVKYSARSEPAVIEVSHERLDDGGHAFTVTDNGVGFDMQFSGKLFGVFQRLHSSSEFTGSGIGLASVRRVLVRHGGDISVQAEPGKGATFRFTLPPPAEATTTFEP